MKKLLLFFTILALICITSCYRNTNRTLLQQKGKAQTSLLQLLQQIDSLNNLEEFDSILSKDYISQTEEFSEAYPEDPMSAEFLYNAGLLAMNIAKGSDSQEEKYKYSQKAISIFDEIHRIYPEFNGIKNCIINKGVVYDDILQDYENAEICFREFIARYPNDTLANNIKSYLQYLGKSPDEIILTKENN